MECPWHNLCQIHDRRRLLYPRLYRHHFDAAVYKRGEATEQLYLIWEELTLSRTTYSRHAGHKRRESDL